jgi:hypothetical protein
MDETTAILGVMGALAGGAVGFGYHVLDGMGEFIFGFIGTFLGAKPNERHEPKPLALCISAGAVVGAVVFGSVPSVVSHFKTEASPKASTPQACDKLPADYVGKSETIILPDGTKACLLKP